jgi:hypothetical protein
MIKNLKYADLAGQVIITIAATIHAIIRNTEADVFFWIYFFTGGWQLASFVIHFFGHSFSWYNGKQRMLYGKVLIWTLILGVLALVTGAMTNGASAIIFFGSALFITPGFAIWYFTIGLNEIQTIKQRELIHLK